MIQLIRIMKTGFRNFFRNLWLSTAATAVMTITLTIILFSYIATTALTSTIAQVVEKIDVSVYLKDEVTVAQANNMKATLEAQPNVESVTFVTKSDALVIYREQNKNNKELLAAVTEDDNPLPQSLAIKAKDPNKIDPIIAVVNRDQFKALLQEKDPVSYTGERKKTIDRIIGATNFIKQAGLVASALFVVISTLIIFNTIRMAIFTRREEIEIMKLVGATNWFIRGPFIFEAALYGIIATIISVVLCYSLVLGVGPQLGSYIDTQTIIEVFRNHPFVIISVELLIGVVIGATSSLLAMSRYMKLS
jgi:cell division transport system permease protein